MSSTEGKITFISWLTSIPPHVPDELGRYYLYWKIFYFLAGVSHFGVLLLFLQFGVTFMVVFNVFSVALFAAAFALLPLGYYRTAYWAAVAELTLHGIAATVCVGTAYGFQLYPFLVVILLFIQPFYPLRVSFVLAALTLTSAGLVTFYAENTAPLYVIPEDWHNAMVVAGVTNWPIFVLVMVLPFVRASARAEKELAAAYGETERLLLNILPAPIAERLKTTEGMIADDHNRVAILFADIVGFTDMSGRLRPAEVVTLLNGVFNAIDGLVEKYGVEKIKTIGDAYMVVAGLPNPIDDPDETIARLALDIRSTVAGFKVPGTDDPLGIRIGINSGTVVAGVIGNRKFAYDLWGDAVNVAARMEATGEEGMIQASDEFAAPLKDRFAFEPRGEIEIKGKGKIATSFLIDRRPA